VTTPRRFLIGLAAFVCLSLAAVRAAGPALVGENIFPPGPLHCHASCVVELPNGDLLACWFYGSGERTADDVRVEGARLKRGGSAWSPRFTLADTPSHPDCNPTMFLDARGRLWLVWMTILANTWESALLKYRIAADPSGDAAPRWDHEGVIHLQPGAGFAASARKYWEQVAADLPRLVPEEVERRKVATAIAQAGARVEDKLAQRLGWMPRAHPQVLAGGRILLPLYSDGFDFSLMAWSDDDGQTWQTSAPLLGLGNVQPSVVARRDGSLMALMRDNGPPPFRLHQSESRDRGVTWTPVTDTALPNPGSGAEVIALANGHWALIGNDTETGRHRLTVQISDDEGRSWRWRRSLEDDSPGPSAGRYHYPSLIQSRDGSLHATYSHHRPPAEKGGAPEKTIRHVRFDEAWVQAGAHLGH